VTDRSRIHILCTSDYMVANMILACFDLLYCTLGLNANLASMAVSYMIAPRVHLHLVLPGPGGSSEPPEPPISFSMSRTPEMPPIPRLPRQHLVEERLLKKRLKHLKRTYRNACTTAVCDDRRDSETAEVDQCWSVVAGMGQWCSAVGARV
jgi:hypothetical protein